jgi:hypothetical protein
MILSSRHRAVEFMYNAAPFRHDLMGRHDPRITELDFLESL